MTRQKEIKEGIAKQFFLEERTNRDYDYRRPCWEELGISAKLPYIERAEKWCAYLYSQGVVISVDRELPQNPFARESGDNNGFIVGRDFMLRAGFEAVESLIGGLSK